MVWGLGLQFSLGVRFDLRCFGACSSDIGGEIGSVAACMHLQLSLVDSFVVAVSEFTTQTSKSVPCTQSLTTTIITPSFYS